MPEEYNDTMSLGGQPMDGPGKNFKDLLVWRYYDQKLYVDKAWPTTTSQRGLLDLLNSLLDYVPDPDRNKELVGLVDTFYDQAVYDLYQRKKAARDPKVAGIPDDPDTLVVVEAAKKKLDSDDLFGCYSKACKQVKYMVQGEINRAHGLVKERAVGVTFPYMSKGRFIFPMSIVPPDGIYTSKESGREWDFRLHSTLMRRKRKTPGPELQLDDMDEDRNVGYVSDEDFPTPRSRTLPLTAAGEYITERVAANLTYDELTGLVQQLVKEYKPDRDVYDDFGHAKARKIVPIDHREMNRLRKLEDENNYMDIARFLAETVTGRETMNVLLLGVGMSGSGKSMGTNHLLWGISVWIADILDSDPANWRKYYPYWTNCRVIDKDGFTDLFKDLGYMTIKFGDDAFNALNRTEFQSDFIKELNTIAATDRIFRGVTAFSCQWAGMIDKVIRDLAGYRIDFKRDKNARAWNDLNKCKFHLLDYNQYDKHNPLYTRYFHTHKADVEDHYAGMPPEEMREWYDAYRILGAVALKKKPKDQDPKDKFRCPKCRGADIRANKDGTVRCRKCGHTWRLDDADGNGDSGKTAGGEYAGEPGGEVVGELGVGNGVGNESQSQTQSKKWTADDELAYQRDVAPTLAELKRQERERARQMAELPADIERQLSHPLDKKTRKRK